MKIAIVIGLVIFASTVSSPAQKITSERSPLDGVTSTTIEFQGADIVIHDSASLQPRLQVQCSSKHRADIYLRVGSLENVSNGYVQLRMRLDQGKVGTWSWAATDDPSLFRYEGAGPSFGLYRSVYPKQKLLKDLANTQSVYIEFQPFEANKQVAASISVNGLRQFLDSHRECK